MRLFLFVSFLVSVAQAQVKTEVRFAPVANFIYQLDCVSGVADHCSVKNYKKLWQDEFLKTPEDQKWVDRWSALMSRYDQSVAVNPEKKISNSPRYIGVNLYTKARIASLQAESIKDYLERLDLILNTQSRIEAEQIVNHFYPAFEKWWNKVAVVKGQKVKKKTEALITKKENQELINKFSHFYEVQLPKDYPIIFSLYYRPDVIPESTAGQQLQNYGVIEFLSDEDPKDRIDVVIHELCHFFYVSGPEGKFDELQRRLSKNQDALSSYNLLNEGLASAFGNGMIARQNIEKSNWEKILSKEQSFYMDHHIDKTAKTLLTWLDAWLEAGRTLYDPQFPDEYLKRLQAAFGSGLSNPRSLLKSMVLVSDDKFTERFDVHARRAMKCNSQWHNSGAWDPETLKEYRAQKNTNALLVVHPDNLKALKKANIITAPQLKAMTAALKKQKQLLYALQPSPERTVYVISAPDAKKAQALIDQLAAAKRNFSGMYESDASGNTSSAVK